MLVKENFHIWILVGILTVGLVSSSQYWSITNQMKVEERPYTKTPADPSVTGPTFRSKSGHVQLTTFREMHRFCDGQCFYSPAACSGQTPARDYIDVCEIAASIAMHNEDRQGELYCDFFGTEDNLRKSFCTSDEPQQAYRNKTGRFDKFFSITLHRTLNSSQLSCSNKWNDATGRRCRRTEFVAISFVNNQGNLATPFDAEELWYVCTIDESFRSRVTMWTNENGNGSAHQIVGTKPHLESGVGVVFSKVNLDEDLDSLGCQFVIQQSNMTLLDPPKKAGFFGDLSHQPITVKLAGGHVDRELDDDTIMRPVFTSVFFGPDVSPTNQIYFNSLGVTISERLQNPQKELDTEEEHAKVIKELINKCDKPQNYPTLYIGCYPPRQQKNCVHTGRCPAMFIVEVPRSDTSFDTMKAYLYGSLPDTKTLRKVRRPMGYVSVGFSFDEQMGRDVVISCHANGRSNMSVVVSINYEKTNVYPGLVNYSSLIYNTQTFGTVHKSKILCSWEMKTQFVVNMFAYEPDYREIIHPGLSEKLEYDFRRDSVYLLIAAGNRNYPEGKIVHHDFRESLDMKFNKTLFFEYAHGARLVKPYKFLIVLQIFVSLWVSTAHTYFL